MLAQLPHNTPSVSDLPNGWAQVSFTLNIPFTLEIGARLSWHGATLAPWRIQGAHIDCLCLDKLKADAINAPIQLIHAGQALPHLNAEQPLLITGEGLGIADVLLSCSQLKPFASNSLVLLSADYFPCIIKPAKFMVEALPNAIAACPLLEDWGFANRLVHAELPGCIDLPLDQLCSLPNLQNYHQALHFQPFN